MDKTLSVKCPTCEKKFNYYKSEFRPFCCEKCKMIDLGHWFDESYTIEGRDGTVYIEENDKPKSHHDDENF